MMVKTKNLSNLELRHKIKSPLTSIIGFADMLEIHLKENIPASPGIKWAQKIKSEALRVNDMLDKMRLSS